MKLENHTKYDTRTLGRICRAIYAESVRPAEWWASLVVEVHYLRTTRGTRPCELAYETYCGALRHAREEMFEYARSTMGGLAGCSLDACPGSVGLCALCSARFAVQKATAALRAYERRATVVWSTSPQLLKIELHIPRHRFSAAVLGQLLNQGLFALRRSASYLGVTAYREFEPPAATWLAEKLGIPDELEETKPAKPTEEQRAARARRRRAAKVRSLHNRKKSWTTKLKRAQNALKKIEKALHRMGEE